MKIMLQTGSDLIDKPHDEIIAKLKIFVFLMEGQSAPDTILRAREEFLDVLIRHALQEECLMSLSNYHGFQPHYAAHWAMFRKVSAILEAECQGTEQNTALVKFVQEFLHKHVVDMDAPLAAFLDSLPRGTLERFLGIMQRLIPAVPRT
ncbi:hypothetical protein [Azospirillum sp. sgz301742]